MNDFFKEKKTFFSRLFWKRVSVVGIIFSLTALFILADAFKQYESTVSILVVPKSEALSNQSGSVIGNIAEFPKTLAFYDRILMFNPDIKDASAGKNPRERKKLWNRQVEVSSGKSQEGSIIRISVFGKTRAQAEGLSEKTVETLFDVVGNFYDIKKDLSVSVIDGPFVSTAWSNRIFVLPLSVLIGFAASLLLNIFLQSFDRPSRPSGQFFKASPLPDLKERFSKKKEEEVEKSEREPEEDVIPQDVPYYFEEDEQAREFLAKYYPQQHDSGKEKIVEDFDKSVYPNFPEIPKGPAKSASAPDNLPIAEEISSFDEPRETKTILEEGQGFVELKKEEPSDEELKERLNKLLKGDM